MSVHTLNDNLVGTVQEFIPEKAVYRVQLPDHVTDDEGNPGIVILVRRKNLAALQSLKWMQVTKEEIETLRSERPEDRASQRLKQLNSDVKAEITDKDEKKDEVSTLKSWFRLLACIHKYSLL